MRPVLYTRKTCPHCATVKRFLQANGLNQAVIIRDVDSPAIAQELRRFWPSGGVPTLVANGRVLAGDANEVIAALRSMFRVPAIAPAGRISPAGQASTPSSFPWEPIVLIGALIGFGALELFMGEESSLPRKR